MMQQAKSVQPSFHEVLDEFGPAGRLSDSHPLSPNTLQNRTWALKKNAKKMAN
jgi:hypothetical protein